MVRRAAIVLIAMLSLAGCSRHKPPVGRWEGAYQTADTIIAARLEIGKNGQIRVSAPDTTNIAMDATENDRQSIRDDMAARLASGWGSVEPRKMDYDGHTFRKPGGIAPQMIWDADTKQMTLVLYLGANPALNVPLHHVDEFNDDPFTH